MSTLQILQDILIRDYTLTREQVVPEAVLSSLGLDSLSVLELMFKIEDRFLLKITGDTPTDLVTVGDVARLIEAHPPLGRTVRVDITSTGLNVSLDAAGGGNLTIRGSGNSSTADQLGLLSPNNIGAGPRNRWFCREHAAKLSNSG